MYQMVCAIGSIASRSGTIFARLIVARALSRQWSLLTKFGYPSSMRSWYGTCVYGAWMRTPSATISFSGRPARTRS